MAQDTKYEPKSYVYDSRGLAARWTYDEVPEFYYIQLLNCLERSENTISSRYGYQIVNRDAAGTPNGQNYLFQYPVVTIAKINFQSYPQRYAFLANGSVYQLNSNGQGEYTELTLPLTAQGQQVVLSGDPVTWLVESCLETSLPFLFIADASFSIKVPAQSSTPQLWGIDPPPQTLNVNPYAPLLLIIDDLSASNFYDTTGFPSFGAGSWGWGAIETLQVQSGQLITDFSQFYGVGPASGGTSTYFPSPTGVSQSAARSTPGTTTVTSSIVNSIPSIVPAFGETVAINGQVSGVVSAGGDASGYVNFQYSPDGGATWITFFNLVAAGYDFTQPVISFIQSISTSNLNLIQFRIVASCTVDDNTVHGASSHGTFANLYVTVTNPGAFGPIVNGMLSILNGTVPVNVPIVSATSTGLSAGLYQELLIATSQVHNLVPGDLCGVYASSSDLVDGFYQVVSTPSPTEVIVYFAPIGPNGDSSPPVTLAGSATQIGAIGGYLTYNAPSASDSASNYAGTPFACVLSDQYSTPYPSQMSAWGFNQWVPPTNSQFPISAWSGTIGGSSTGTVSKTITLDLNQNNEVTDSDLIVLTLLTSSPENVAQVSLQFFVGEGQNNYYQAFISPAYYQGAVSGNILAYQATQSQILADTLNLITGQTPGTTSAQLQPSNLSTGSGSWQACLIPRGNFLPVGQAGQAGVDWSNVTGWQITFTTNSNGGASFSVNGLYLQWGYGPSSFAGVGYDWRYTYYNAGTGTESSPCPISTFNEDFGYLASTSAPIFLRQAAQCLGYYSNDPQVTHVRLYRRGGILASNWVQTVQAPNVTGGGQFCLKDVIGDQFVLQAPPLVLDNDPPVTSSLVTPIQTNLAAATTGPGGSIYSTFSPQLVTVADVSAVFVPNQIVLIGNANNLEEVAVISGGVGQFSAILRLQHNQGEPLQVNATPRTPCNLCCIVNLPGGATQVIMAGDESNPGRIYYAKPNQPESFGPENYLDSPSPDDPVMALINWRGTGLVATRATWYIFVGGSQPYLQPTGAAHGMIATQGWTLAESIVAFRSADGWRFFSGADGKYMTLPVEWIFRTNPQCLPPQVSASNAYQDVFAYFNNCTFGSYISLSGERYRLVWDHNYQRFRQDDIAATAMLWERDTNLLLCGVPILTASNTIGYAVVEDQQYNQDYDDGGWNSALGVLVQTPINLTIQTPYRDLGKPHFPKQWNVLEGDYNTANQNIQTTLLFDTEPPTSLVLPAANTGTQRQKIQYQISDGTEQGEGFQAYSMSIQHTMAVTVAPTLYQENVYAAILADYRSSFDSYWQKASMDELKLWKEGYFDYTATEPVEFSLYANGSMAFPYWTFTLPVQANRAVVRCLFPAYKCRLWRMIGVSTGDFQLWAPVQVDAKPLLEGSGYERVTYGVYE